MSKRWLRRDDQVVTTRPAANPMTASRRGRALLLLLAASAACAPAIAAGDDPVAVGHALVQAHCGGCHATERTGESPLAAAPKLRELHLRYDVQLLSEALVEGIVTAHPNMPQFEFDPFEAEAIIAYLKSLER